MSPATHRLVRFDDLPSLLFLVALAANTACIATTGTAALRLALQLPQALLLLGCQEAKHLAVWWAGGPRLWPPAPPVSPGAQA